MFAGLLFNEWYWWPILVGPYVLMMAGVAYAIALLITPRIKRSHKSIKFVHVFALLFIVLSVGSLTVGAIVNSADNRQRAAQDAALQLQVAQGKKAREVSDATLRANLAKNCTAGAGAAPKKLSAVTYLGMTGYTFEDGTKQPQILVETPAGEAQTKFQYAVYICPGATFVMNGTPVGPEAIPIRATVVTYGYTDTSYTNRVEVIR